MSTTVLAVDDSVTMRRVLEITFGGEEFNAVLAASAEQALHLLASERPAIALVDHTIGNADGYDLCRNIKSTAPQTKVIILSSKQHPYDRGRGTAAGADDFMDKPFDTEKMLEKVRQVAAQPSKAVAAAAPVAPKSAPIQHAPVQAAPLAAAPRTRTHTLSYGTSAPGAAPSGGATPGAGAGAGPRQSPTLPGATAGAASKGAATPKPAAAAPKPAASRAPVVSPAQVGSAAAAATAGNGQLAGKLEGLGLSPEQVHAVLALSREVVEQVVWEVVPVLAETLIKEEIRRLTSD